MKYAFTPTMLCRYRAEPNAACRTRPRCKRCNRRLPFGERDLCPTCRNIRDIARSRFAKMAANHITGTATGAQALASGLNVARVGVLAGLSERAILSALQPGVPRLAHGEFREDLKAALRGMKMEVYGGRIFL